MSRMNLAAETMLILGTILWSGLPRPSTIVPVRPSIDPRLEDVRLGASQANQIRRHVRASASKTAAGVREDVSNEGYRHDAREMRVVFEREVDEGRNRVVIGTVNQVGEDFEPGLIIYVEEQEIDEATTTIIIAGDLMVTGTASSSSRWAARPDSQPERDMLDAGRKRMLEDWEGPSSQVNRVGEHVAGAAGNTFRAFLVSDAGWLDMKADLLSDPSFMEALRATGKERIEGRGRRDP